MGLACANVLENKPQRQKRRVMAEGADGGRKVDEGEDGEDQSWSDTRKSP